MHYHYRHTFNILARVIATADKLGARMPKTLAADYARLLGMDDKITDLERNGRADLSAAVFAALMDGRDPATDPTVRDAVTARDVGDTVPRLREELGLQAHRLANEHAADLLAAFEGPFDKAAGVLATAAARLGDVGLNEDAPAVLGLGGDAARVWLEACEADAVIRDVRQAWATLGTVAPAVRVDPRYQLLIIADVPPESFAADRLDHAKLSAWDAVRRGFPLSLATPTTIRARIDGVLDEERGRRARDADMAFTNAVKRVHGIGAR